ncbi:LacI family DNA-binding transcriptional regulator [Actinacidiphila sp. DG2A-62]|uniref:LacI family DNA-binding transcriptional regulator n=1 Tax=Actinacidiphila sp. DG2A-62 TaxID=3108821 RepID=UPI002DBB62CD|nr:LacI family DNA-binding transcriptional regulator [Actinacidiphila sp. DG2A-62]MEC3995819.1 LacI family DNA-binding transcriptional regulator [Actinacidiphila sp. DG2A-62]
MARVRMRDVAEHAGVSVRTVSNVVSGYTHVSPATRARVQRSLDELGYRMDYLARGLRSGRTGFVALAVPFLAEPYFAELAQAVVKAAARRGITVLVESTGGDSEVERRILSGGLTNVADGVLLSALTLPSDAAVSVPDFPLVLLGEHSVGDGFPRVGIDNVAAARTAVEHLLEQGCRRIVALGRNGSENGRQRTEGYRQALAAAGVRKVNWLVVPVDDWTRKQGYEAVRQLLDGSGPLPDGIFAFNDALAIGALRALDASGVRVPQEVAVASVDDVQEAAYAHPPLTSIAPDLDVIAERALTLLDQQAGAADRLPDAPADAPDAPHAPAGPEPAPEPTPFRLVVRESSRRLDLADQPQRASQPQRAGQP